MNERIRVALGQLAIADGEKEANLQKIEQAIQEAHKQQADLLILPELVLTGFVPELKRLAEARDGVSLQKVQQMLSRYPMRLVFSFPEIADDVIYITTVLLDRDGQPVAFYRKNHLFTQEAEQITPGSELVRVPLAGWQLGLLTCYDIEFPEPARKLALEGIDLLLVNSANMEPFEEIHHLFIRARAVENHCFVAYCNRLGANDQYTYHGRSALISPSGEVIMDIEEDVETVQTAEISIRDVAESKRMYNYLRDRRITLL